MINSLQANLYANVVVASPVVGEAVGIIKIHTGTDGVVLAFLGEGNEDRSTDGRAGEEGVAVEENRLGNRQLGMVFGFAEFKTITSANHEDVAEAVFQTQGDNVIGVGVGGEGTGEGETVLSVVASKAFSGEVVLAEFGILTAVGCEALWNFLAKRKQTLYDMTAVETGLLKDSVVLCENPERIAKQRIGRYITTLSRRDMGRVAEAYLLSASAISFLDQDTLLRVWATASKLNATNAESA